MLYARTTEDTRCKRCGIVQIADNFGSHPNKRNGLKSNCNNCRNGQIVRPVLDTFEIPPEILASLENSPMTPILAHTAQQKPEHAMFRTFKTYGTIPHIQWHGMLLDAELTRNPELPDEEMLDSDCFELGFPPFDNLKGTLQFVTRSAISQKNPTSCTTCRGTSRTIRRTRRGTPAHKIQRITWMPCTREGDLI